MIKDANLVLIVENHHVLECGAPPSIRQATDDDNYVGYFENTHGEQFVVVINRAEQTGELRGGDLNWSTVIPIRQGHIEGDVILGDDEYQWLSACWRAACGCSLK